MVSLFDCFKSKKKRRSQNQLNWSKAARSPLLATECLKPLFPHLREEWNCWILLLTIIFTLLTPTKSILRHLIGSDILRSVLTSFTCFSLISSFHSYVIVASLFIHSPAGWRPTELMIQWYVLLTFDRRHPTPTFTSRLDNIPITVQLAFIHRANYIVPPYSLVFFFVYNSHMILKVIHNLFMVWMKVSKWRKWLFVTEPLKMLKLSLFKN